MKQRHTEPCAECPWRTDSLKGYLGGHTPEMYADAVHEGVIPACHCKDFGPEDERTAFCAGAAATMKRSAKMAEEMEPGQEGAEAMRQAVGMREDVFAHPALFFTYHADRPYVPRMFRQMEDA